MTTVTNGFDRMLFDDAANEASARCSFQLTYARAPVRRDVSPTGITGGAIDDAYRPGESSPGEWCADNIFDEHDVDGWIDAYAEHALNEAIHEALEWFQVDGKPWLDPHGRQEYLIYELTRKLARELADLRRGVMTDE